ncbi:MAG: S-methyl-5-thioribose-1-phosphate isomerase [Pseudomonadales bacterium]|nr:S-methyl-5-thioribose-1-phosphate isomerase [Pseudomonadales bacterium]
MQVDGKHYRSIWTERVSGQVQPLVCIIDQTRLPHDFSVLEIQSLDAAVGAIFNMQVRGAPLIGAMAAFGVYLAMQVDASDSGLSAACEKLLQTRPTAVNLRWALDEVNRVLSLVKEQDRVSASLQFAEDLCMADIDMCASIGEHGLALIKTVYAKKPANGVVNILTHCNAGWLATVDWGTALAPIYKAQAAGISVHVWVDETRPRNQGAYLTTWELNNQGIAHTLIVDNAGGHLMQHGLVDMCIVGTDRTTRSGDVCNKIGTYLKALAAYDNGVPFYVAAPSPSIDWTIRDGLAEIPIEQRSRDEVAKLNGMNAQQKASLISIVPDHIQIRNDAFDTTPARLITGLITERGIADANETDLLALFPEQA